MADQPGDDTHDYVVVPRPGNAHGVEYSTGEPPHVIQELKIWLSPTDSTSPASEYRKHLNSRAPGTGKWILDTDQYRRWSDTDRIGDLWIRGIPGSGKSVVAASMVDGLQQRGDAPVLFFFFREIIETNRSPRSLSRDFCHGLLAHSTLLQSTLKKLKGQNPNVGTVPFSEIWECLSSALAAMPKVYCVVDALDEMEPGHGQFLHDLLNLGRKSPKSIKLILTSRQLPHLEKHLGGSCLLDLRLDRRNVDRDIAIYITQRFKSEATLTKDEASEIKVAICERGKGLFLYARLVTDQLLLHPTIILPQLSQLPDGLGSMYTDILRDHAARSQTTAEFQRLVLEWVVYSARPLRLIELATMVDSLADRGGLSASQNAKLAIRSTCGPLLEVCEDGVIQIIHHSLAEFLLNRDVCHIQDARNYREFAVLNDQIAHENIARACVSYFTCCYMEGLEQYTHNTEAGNRALWQRFHFLRYASENWPYHASKVNPTKDFLSFLDGFFDRPACFASWANLWDDPDIRVCSKLTSLHVAAHSGLCAYTEHLLVNGADPECLDGYNRTPLTYAAIQGHSKIAQILLDHKARYNLIDDDMMGPMHYAAKLNQAEVVRVLLDAGANPLASVQHKEPDESGSYRGKYGNFDEGETPLSYACRHGNARIFMELQNYIDPLTLRRGFLHLAAESSQAKIVSLLLSHEEVRCGINDLNCKGNTALYIAARYQSSEAVQTLLKHGADISIRSQERSTKPGHPEASQIIEGQERSFTPLHGWAQLPGFGQISWRRCDERSREVLQLLIKAGCDINATDHKGRTSLFAWGEFWNDFSGGKSAAFLSLLLENGADASIVDLDGGSPLHQIQHHREKRPVVELLVGAGADINAARVTDGMTPVHLIAKGGSWTDPLLLSQLKADFTRQDLQGNTPLHYVCQEWRRISRYKEAWLSLSDLNIQNHAGRTPLAEFLGHNYGNETREDLALFIDWGASLETRDYQGRTALLISLSRIFRRRRQWIPELLRLGANVNATSFRGKSGTTIEIPLRAQY